MQIMRPPHNWSVSPKQAIAIQRRIGARVRQEATNHPIRLVAGVDAAFDQETNICIAAVILWDKKTATQIEQRVAVAPLKFPYIPGLLSFREAPAIVAALRKLHRIPDAVLCDGQGIAHPRRCGIASHLGVLADLPTVGCAKSRLLGTYQQPGIHKGAATPLWDKGQLVGTVLRTRERVKPVFVSVGHRIDLTGAEQLVLDCTAGYRLPEPTRLADRLVAATKKQLLHRH